MELVLDFMPASLSYTQEDVQKLSDAVRKILPVIPELKISANNNPPDTSLWIDVKDFDFGIKEDFHGEYEIVEPICIEILRFLVAHGAMATLENISIAFNQYEISVEAKTYKSLEEYL